MQENLPILYLVRTGWRHAGKQRRLMVTALCLFGFAQATMLSEPWVIGQLLNCVQKNVSAHAPADKFLHDIYYYLSLFFTIEFVFWIFHGPGRFVERVAMFHIKVNYKCRLFQILTELPLQWHRDHHSGDSIDKINKATNSLADFFDASFEVTYMLFRFIGTQIILFFFMPVAGAVAISTAIVAVTIIFKFDQVLTKQYRELNRMENYVASAVHDYVTNIISVITLRLEGPVVNEVQKRLLNRWDLFKVNATLNEFKWFLTTLVIVIMTVAVLLWYTHKTLAAGEVIMAGTFFTLFEYLRRIGDSFYSFAYIYGTVVQQAANVHNADSILDAYDQLKSDTKPYALPENWQNIRIENLHFTYEDEKHREHHLENVSLELTRGGRIALVGESGSGKSTLLSLLRGVQPANEVDVFCDGERLPGKLAHLSHTTTLMPQDPEIFADTIRTNVTFALEDDEKFLGEAIEMSGFDQVLARLPKRLDTNIAEKGVNLSGGEKQRLALARGLYFAKSSSLLLLDEPTSSVDALNERLIYERILAGFPDRCIVTSIHKLHLLELFERIYVFEDGRVIESGTFSELLARQGKLASMWRKYQASQDYAVTYS
jgi:ATP-binding cassette subfamily B protein